MLRKRLFLICLSVVVLFLAATAAQASYMDAVLADNPVGYWRLGENGGTTAYDSTSNHADGTAGTGVALGGVNPGALPNDINKAATFDAVAQVTSEVTVNNNTTGNFGKGDSFSLEAWFKADHDLSNAPGEQQVFFSKYKASGGGGNNVGYNMSLLRGYGYSPNTSVWFTIGNEDVTAAYTQLSSSLADGQWHHAVATYNGSISGTKIYIDGAEASLGIYNPGGFSGITDIKNTDPVRIGGHNAMGVVFAGALDEMAMYSGVLSGSQIANHWAHRNDIFTPEPGTLVLLASGLIGLLAYAWRKRK